jgi:hemolysin activation/secretion protein
MRTPEQRSAPRLPVVEAVLRTVPRAFLPWHFAGFFVLFLVLALSWEQPVRGGTGLTFEPVPAPVGVLLTNGAQQFVVSGYALRGDPLLTNAAFTSVLEQFTGTNVSLTNLVTAASELQAEYRAGGYSNVVITLGRDQITNGIATLNVFRGAIPQIVMEGRRCTPTPVAPRIPYLAATRPGQTNAALAAASTNAPTPGFPVRAYEISGDTLLSEKTLINLLQKYIGTNITLADIGKARYDLQKEYIDRGYPTVKVIVPQQTLDTNFPVVKMRVFEGRLSQINVLNNRYFSSNNVMRALPSLHTNMILVGPVFQAELDRANANQDRQIYPEIRPGQGESTTALDLTVKDRLPLHAKIDFNNQSSPGTPELRLNASAVYDNLWQLEHSLGIQYGWSPGSYKTGDQWAFYDRPLVANYSGFYRLPLGNPPVIEDLVTSLPGSFGYSEASRQFRLPPPSGRSELNVFASRSTVDTGVEILRDEIIYSVPGVRQVSRQDVQQDLTINGDVGLRLSQPLPEFNRWRSTLSGGVDYKTYSLTSSKTNIFSFTEYTVDENGNPNPPIVSTVFSPVPTTVKALDYLPLALRYDGGVRDKLGFTSFGLGISGNTWHSGSLPNLQSITDSTESSGYWVILTPSMSRDFLILTNWTLAFRAEGQWASQPLISTEQFGIGGVNSVRGYREGEVFGDTGWRVGAEQKTPPHMVGMVYGRNPLTVRGSIYMDYAETYLLDSQGRQGRTPLWGTGFGGVFSVGPHFEARFLFSWPLLGTTTTEAYQPRFNFSLSAQF